jgi:hypothetical protein
MSAAEKRLTMHRTLSGTFQGADLGGGHWRFVEPAGTAILLDGAPAQRAPPPVCDAIRIEWDGAAVLVTLRAVAGAQTFRARAASIQEPLPALYDGLPLGRFDARARRFWWRVFRIARVPGGAALLRAIARRRGGGG